MLVTSKEAQALLEEYGITAKALDIFKSIL